MDDIVERLGSLAQKTLSSVRSVRLRAYRNLLSKKALSTRGAFAELYPGTEHYEEVLQAVDASIARAVGDDKTEEDVEEALLACELAVVVSKENMFSDWLRRAAGMKRIRLDTLVTTLHNTLDSDKPIEPRLQPALQELYNALCSVRSHIEPEDTQLFPVEETSRTFETTSANTMPRDVNRLYDILHAKMQDESLCMHGWKFPTVFVSPMDEKHLLELQTRLLTAPDQPQTIAVLLELSGAAILDYPAAVFLQQQGFVLALLQLLALPDTNVVIGTDRTQDSTTEEVKAAVLDVLHDMAQAIVAGFRLHLDGRFCSTFDGGPEVGEGDSMPPDAAEHYLVNRVQQYRYPRYDRFPEQDAASSRTWSVGGAMFAFCSHAIPLLRSSQTQLFAKACSLLATCLPFCLDPTTHEKLGRTAFERLDQLSQLLAQTVSYYETMMPADIPCERNMAEALSLVVTQREGANKLVALEMPILCCGEVIVRFFDVVAAQAERALDVEEVLAASPLLTMLERMCLDTALRAFVGDRISDCEALLCRIKPEGAEQLDHAQQARRQMEEQRQKNHDDGNHNRDDGTDEDVSIADAWAIGIAHRCLELIGAARSHRQLSDGCFNLLALAGLRSDVSVQLPVADWESAVGRILQLAPSTTKDYASLCSVMQCVSLILRPSNFSHQERSMQLKQCLAVAMSESQEAVLASILPATLDIAASSMSTRSLLSPEMRPSHAATSQAWVAFCLQKMLLQLILDACTTMQRVGRSDDNDEWEQFISQIMSSQWLSKALYLLKHAVSSYNSFKGVVLVRLVLQTFESLYQLGHSEILFARAGLPGEGMAEEDADTSPMALTLISRAAKSVALPESFRGGCIRTRALAMLQLTAISSDADRAAMERHGLLSRDKQWLLRLATDRRAEIRYFALEWYQLVGSAVASDTGVVPDWLLHSCVDAAEASIVRMQAMAIAANSCLDLLRENRHAADDEGKDGPDCEQNSKFDSAASTLRMLFAAACEGLATRPETQQSAHGLLASVHTMSLILSRLFPTEGASSSTAVGGAEQQLQTLRGEITQMLRTHRVVPRLVEFLRDEILLSRLSHSFHTTTGAPSYPSSSPQPGWNLLAASIFSSSHLTTARDVQAGACEVLRAVFAINPPLLQESMRHTSVFHNTVNTIFSISPRQGASSSAHSFRALCSACELLSSILACRSPATQALIAYAPSIGYSVLVSITAQLELFLHQRIYHVDVTPLLRLAGLVLNTPGWSEQLTNDLDLGDLPHLLMSFATLTDRGQAEKNAEAALLLLCMLGQHRPDLLATAVAEAPDHAVRALVAPIQEICRAVAQQSSSAVPRSSSFSRSRAPKCNPLPGMAKPYTNPKWRSNVKSFNMADSTTLSSIPASTMLTFDADDIQQLFFSTCFLQACMDTIDYLSPGSQQLLKRSAGCLLDLLRIWQQAYTANRPEDFVYARPLGHAILTTFAKMQQTFSAHELEQLVGTDWLQQLLKVVQNSRLDSNSRCIASVCLQNAPSLLAVRSAVLAELQRVLDRYTHRTRTRRQHYPKVDVLFQLCALIHTLAACFSAGDLDVKERAPVSTGTKDDPPVVPLLDWAVQAGTELVITDGSPPVATVHGSIHPSLASAVLHALGVLCTSESRRLRANMLSETALLLLCDLASCDMHGQIREKAILCLRALLAGNETTRAIMKNHDKMRPVLSEIDQQLLARAARDDDY